MFSLSSAGYLHLLVIASSWENYQFLLVILPNMVSLHKNSGPEKNFTVQIRLMAKHNGD